MSAARSPRRRASLAASGPCRNVRGDAVLAAGLEEDRV